MYLHGRANRRSLPVEVYIQGGGALGAFPAGAIESLLSHPEIDLVGAGGTSSGAVTARALINGYTHGLANGGKDAARRGAVENVKLVWKKLIEFQAEKLPLWYTAGNIYFSHLPSHLRHSFRKAAREHGRLHQSESPLLAFYRFLNKQGKDLCPTAGPDAPFLAVNTTLYQDGMSLWKATPKDERVFYLNGLSRDQQQRAVAASGTLDFSLPVEATGDGTLHHDGAFSSAIPDPLANAHRCYEEGRTMIILRTRPTNAFRSEDRPETSENGIRTHFNAIMDQSVKDIRKAFPKLKLIVIEPASVEPDTDHFLNNEMRFDTESFQQRYAAGKMVAEHVLEQELGLTPQQAPQQEIKTSRYSGDHFIGDAMRAAANMAFAPQAIMAAMFTSAFSGANTAFGLQQAGL